MISDGQVYAGEVELSAKNPQCLLSVQADVPVPRGCIPPIQAVFCQVFPIRYVGRKKDDAVGGKQ